MEKRNVDAVPCPVFHRMVDSVLRAQDSSMNVPRSKQKKVHGYIEKTAVAGSKTSINHLKRYDRRSQQEGRKEILNTNIALPNSGNVGFYLRWLSMHMGENYGKMFPVLL